MNRQLAGQVAVISGGLGDIGRAIASELAGRGADVAISDVHPRQTAQPFFKELRTQGGRAIYSQVDVTDAAAVAAWVQTVENDWGVPTLIIPNAAIVTLADIRTVTADQWSRELRVNLDGAFHLAQAGALRLLHHQKPGRIVFIGSWVGHAPHPHIPAYCVAKAGMRMLMKCMALELAPHDILVNEVAPGYVDAGLSKRLFDETPGARETATGKVPLGRLMTPQDVALEVAHLCDPAVRHTTGSVVLMDGGLSLRTQ